MHHIFYDLIDYKKGQSKIARDAWQKGFYDHLLAKTEERRCKRAGCNNVFNVKYYDPKQFCSHACSATHNNHVCGPMRPEVKFKTSESVKRSPYHYTAKGKILVPRLIKN